MSLVLCNTINTTTNGPTTTTPAAMTTSALRNGVNSFTESINAPIRTAPRSAIIPNDNNNDINNNDNFNYINNDNISDESNQVAIYR